MSDKQQHTPPEWRYLFGVVWADSETAVASCHTPEFGAQIVREHNAHEELVAAGKAVLTIMKDIHEGEGFEPCDAMPILEAALAKAEGGTDAGTTATS